jgi:hypothetical protein
MKRDSLHVDGQARPRDVETRVALAGETKVIYSDGQSAGKFERA